MLLLKANELGLEQLDAVEQLLALVLPLGALALAARTRSHQLVLLRAQVRRQFPDLRKTSTPNRVRQRSRR